MGDSRADGYEAPEPLGPGAPMTDRPTVPGFEVTDLAARSRDRVWYRAIRSADKYPVLLRLAIEPAVEHAALQREAGLVGELIDKAPVAPVLGIAETSAGPALVVVDDRYEFLGARIPPGGMALDLFLRLALDMATALAALHAAEVTHQDIRPANILVGPGQTVRLTGLARAARVPREGAAPSRSAPVGGDPAYFSPEQTGRLNRPIDPRSDLYSLGITFHEMLTGSPPFRAADAMGWIHSHIARQPAAIDELRPQVPSVVALLVLKLLAKAPEARYQTAEGVARDLATCLDAWLNQEVVAPFALGRFDRPLHLAMPQRVIGRDKARARLADSFDRVARGQTELVLVTGITGIGKSALVQELGVVAARRSGYFVGGKFDQNRRDIPYRAVIEALREFCRHILGEGPERLQSWRRRLVAALGDSAAIIADSVPEMRLILGDIPAAGIATDDSQNRFQATMSRFVAALASEQPLVLFLDDLHWADRGSLKLLTALLTDPDMAGLMVVGAYRDREVVPDDPLPLAIASLGSIVPVITLALSPLSAAETAEWMAEALGWPAADALPLASLLTERCDGNPFFLGQMVSALARDGMIRFDGAAGTWIADLDTIRRCHTADDLASLLASRLGDLPEAARDALALAASVGSRFDLDTLAALTGTRATRLTGDLLPALRSGLIRADADGQQINRLQFAHDRIQQAAYELLPTGERPEIHRRLGQRVLARIDAGDMTDAALFDGVTHLNLGRSLIERDEERLRLIQLNRLAAQRAREAMAFEAAFHFLETALDLLAGIEGDRLLRLDLHRETANAARLAGDFAATTRLVGLARAYAQTPLERAALLEIEAAAAAARSEHGAALAHAREALRLLGSDLPAVASTPRILIDVGRIRLAVLGRGIEALTELPAMTDPVTLQTMRLLMTASSAAYLTGSSLFALVALRGTLLSIRKGLAYESGFLMTAAATIMTAALGDIRTGYAFGRAAVEVGNRFGAQRQKLAFGLFIKHWVDPIASSIPLLAEGHFRAREIGDFEYADYFSSTQSSYAYFTEPSLKDARAVAEQALDFSRRRGTPAIRQFLELLLTTYDVFMGEAYEEIETAYPALLSFVDLPPLPQNGLTISSYFYYRAHIALLFGRPVEAMGFIERWLPLSHFILGQTGSVVMPYYECLVLIDLIPGRDAAGKRKARRRIGQILKKLRKFARYAPANHGHRVELIDAELARLDGKNDAAGALFATALDRATQGGFLFDAGQAAERMARFQQELGHAALARFSTGTAYELYRRWGATAKLRQMESLHGAELARRLERGESWSPSLAASDQALDIDTVAKMAQAVSGELRLDRLVDRLLRLAMENAGARFAALVLSDETGLTVPALRGIDDRTALMALGRPLDDTPLSSPVVHFVARTSESVVLEDASRAPQFRHDRRFADGTPRSVLCVPILHQGSFAGALYLENDLVTGAFTEARVELAKLLASQAAIALANARLYGELDQARRELETYSQTLEAMVAARTRDLEQRSAALEAQSERLVQAQIAAETASRTKSAFLANMSHELRTPLNAILGFSEMLRDGLAGPPGPTWQNYAGHVYTAGSHLLTIINDVLDLSKVEAGRMDLDEEPIDVEQLLREVMNLLGPRAKTGGVSLSKSVDPSIPVITGDSVRVKQIVLNLLSNAIKFTAPGGSVRIFVQRAASGAAQIAVADTGTGMTPEEVKLALEPFGQADNGLGRKHEGTGLGLPLAVRLAELHGGSLSIDSQKGLGTTVMVQLPSRLEAPVAPETH
ncbi:MAG TPA: AAA family ATPase [Aliidongia sp.]|nr:AAA family ATPase [Aliidongia sp.]